MTDKTYTPSADDENDIRTVIGTRLDMTRHDIADALAVSSDALASTLSYGVVRGWLLEKREPGKATIYYLKRETVPTNEVHMLDDTVKRPAFTPAPGETAERLAAIMEELHADVERAVRVDVLEEGARLTAGDRNKTYGEPYANHVQIADIFHSMTGIRLKASDIIKVHMATKLSRLHVSPGHRDSSVDLAVYSAILHEIEQLELSDGAGHD